MNNVPSLTAAYIDGPQILIGHATTSDGLTATNSVIGRDTSIYMTGTTGEPQLTLSNSILYGNVFAQQGTNQIYVPGSSYGASYGTIIAGGVTGANGQLEQASLAINAYGSWANIGATYAFASGSITIGSGQPVANYGAMAANDGSLTINMNGTQSPFINAGGLYAANHGTIAVNGVFTQNGAANVDGGTFILGSTTNGLGSFNLASGTMEFLQPFTTQSNAVSANFASSLTTAFTGSSFDLAFSTFSGLAASVQGRDLLITGVYGGHAETLSMTLDATHTYSSSQFTASPTDTNGLSHLTYTAHPVA